MTRRAETAPRHHDPALRTRTYHATAEAVRDALAAAAEETGWRPGGAGGANDAAGGAATAGRDADGGGGQAERDASPPAFAARRRSLLPPSRDALRVHATGHGDAAVRVDAAVEVASPLPTLGRAARALRAFLWAVDARVPQARDTPLRKSKP